MLFSRFAQSAAALVLLTTIGFAAPVYAQQNEQIISGTWYEDRATAAVSNSGLTLTFTQTPSNQFLNITNVACFVQLSPNQVISDVFIVAGTSPGATDVGRIYNIRGNSIPETSSSYKFYSIVTNQIYYKFGPGRYPSIVFDTVSSTSSAFTSADCVIVGNLTGN